MPTLDELQKINDKSLPMKPENQMTEVNTQSLFMAAIKEKVSVDVIERLLTMREKLNQEVAEKAFREAMSGFQSECPIIIKSSKVVEKDGQKVRYKYAPLDVIVAEVQPLLAKYNLSYDINTIANEKSITVKVTVAHILGHKKTTEFTVPIDEKAYMTTPQKWAASQTFAKRYAFCNGLGILTGDQDTDDNSPTPPEKPIKKLTPEEIEKEFKRASDLIETSQTVKNLTERGKDIANLKTILPKDIIKDLSSTYARRMDELIEQKKTKKDKIK